MPPAVSLVAVALAAYLFGSIPFGLLIARLAFGVDVRKHGSGNIGATNVARVLGRKWGAACLGLDALKGLLPTLLLPRVAALPDDWRPAAAVLCGAAAVLGHVFPVWLGFRGGKGVATGAGVAAVLCWPAALAAAAAFGAVFYARRVVALGSIVASVTYAVVTLVAIADLADRSRWPLAAFAVAMPSLIVFRHRDNIRRMLRGEEKRFATGEPESPREPVAHP